MPVKKIAIIGSGYVGVTTAVIAANAGYAVHLIDLNEKRINSLKKRKCFFYEQGVDELLKRALDSELLFPSTSYEGVKEAHIVFSCVGTPDNPDGSSNLEFVESAIKTAAPLMQKGSVYVQKSTVPVGTGEKLKQHLPKNVSYVSNPEFLREGTAIGDTLFFDRVVVGSDDNQAADRVLRAYKDIEEHRNSIAQYAQLDEQWEENAPVGHYISTNLESAELIKVTANAFLALKISFANSIAKLADQSGADVVKVMDAVGADRRIGRAFLNAGRGYGGGCFPKDVSGLISSASEHAVDMPIMTAAVDVNESMPGYIAEKAKRLLGSLEGKTIAVLGLAFKAGTSDARKSPSVALANVLVKNGAVVQAYDPYANEEAADELRKEVVICNSTAGAIKDTDAVFFTVEWPELLSIDPARLKESMKGTLIVDCMNALDADAIRSAGLKYIGVGR